MVVLAIAAILSALSFGAYNSLNSSHKRVSCQANLQQIYQSMRLYMNDNSASPPPRYDSASCASASLPGGLGLWSLYTYSQPDSCSPHLSGSNGINTDPISLGSAPYAVYIRRASVMHCPRDSAETDVNLYSNSARTTFNPKYFSYQVDDSGTPTYQTIRTTDAGDAYWKRQLVHYSGSTLVSRPPTDDTVITWCKWHRTGSSGRNYDNVLFYDGTVQYLENSTSTSLNWKRVPKSPT